MPKRSSANYDVKTIVIFEKQAKRLLKKFPSLRAELTKLIQTLKQTPEQGTALGNNCFKFALPLLQKAEANLAAPE